MSIDTTTQVNQSEEETLIGDVLLAGFLTQKSTVNLMDTPRTVLGELIKKIK